MKQLKYGRYKHYAIGYSKRVGYYYIKVSGKFTLLHRQIAQDACGIALTAENVVHHIDKNKLNNSPDNLVVLENKSEHAELHRRIRIKERGGDWKTQKICDTCGQIKNNEEFHKHKRCANGRSGICVDCTSEYHKKLRQTEQYKNRMARTRAARNARLRLRYRTDADYHAKILASAAQQRLAKLIGWGG